jgi:hypothetical protein
MQLDNFARGGLKTDEGRENRSKLRQGVIDIEKKEAESS